MNHHSSNKVFIHSSIHSQMASRKQEPKCADKTLKAIEVCTVHNSFKTKTKHLACTAAFSHTSLLYVTCSKLQTAHQVSAHVPSLLTALWAGGHSSQRHHWQLTSANTNLQAQNSTTEMQGSMKTEQKSGERHNITDMVSWWGAVSIGSRYTLNYCYL